MANILTVNNFTDLLLRNCNETNLRWSFSGRLIRNEKTFPAGPYTNSIYRIQYIHHRYSYGLAMKLYFSRF
jgi:hypothetical protein